MSAKVSVIIPVHNASDFLGQCLDSILMQTLEDIEVICVDDGSTDDSLQTLQGYGFLDARLKVISQETAGLAAARNRGLKEATGEYVVFLEADDFFDPKMLEKMVRYVEEDKSDLVVAGHFVFDNKINAVSNLVNLDKKYLKHSSWEAFELWGELFNFCLPVSWNKLMRRSLIVENKLHFDEAAPDNDLMFSCLSLACASKITMMKDAFVYSRINTENKTVNKKDDFKTLLKTLGNLYDELKRLKMFEVHLMNYLQRVRLSLQMEILYAPFDQRRELLTLIRAHLKPEIFDKLFSSTVPQVSIIIPVYNTALYLSDCLESVLHQTLQNIEVICVDDGSADNSIEILNQYAQKDKRVRVVHQDHKGQAMARNKALEYATGSLVQFLDSDDYLEPDACECIFLYMQLYGAEMCSFAAIEFDQTTGQEFENDYHCLRWLNSSIPLIFDWRDVQNVLQHIAVSACLTCYRRNFLSRHKIEWIHKSLAYEDTLFFVESMIQAKRVEALPDKFYHRRVHKEAITQNMTTNFKDFVKIAKYTLAKIKELSEDEKLFLIYASTFLTKAWGNFARLDAKAQNLQAKYMYGLYTHLMKKYRLTITLPACTQWCQKYLKNKGTLCEKLKYQLYKIWVKTNRASYTINLIQYTNKPNPCLKILGLPVFELQTKKMPVVRAEQPVYQDIQKNTHILYKLFGLTLLKVEVLDFYE